MAENRVGTKAGLPLKEFGVERKLAEEFLCQGINVYTKDLIRSCRKKVI